MRQPIMGHLSFGGSFNNGIFPINHCDDYGGPLFQGPFYSPDNPTNVALTEIVFVSSGTLEDLHIWTASLLGGTRSITINIKKNGVDTALSATITASSPAGFEFGTRVSSNTTDTVSVVAGDRICMKITYAGSGFLFLGGMSWGLIWNSTSQIILGKSTGGSDTKLTSYKPSGIAAHDQDGIPIEYNFNACADFFPMGGTITGIRLKIDTPPPIGTTRSFYLYYNGSQVSGSIMNFTSSDTELFVTFSQSVSIGDSIAIIHNPGTTPFCNFNNVSWSITFSPSQANKTVFMSGFGQGGISLDTRYSNFVQKINYYTTIPFNTKLTVPGNFKFDKLYVWLKDDASTFPHDGPYPGVGASNTFTTMKSGVAQSLATTISDLNIENSDLVNSVTCVPFDTMQIRFTGSTSPRPKTNCWNTLSLVGEDLDAPVTGNTGSFFNFFDSTGGNSRNLCR